jgi:transglutaminase-like putative cysteine protease
VDLLRPIFEQTRAALTWQSKGKTLPLEVIRRGGGQRLGIERAFVTFLRCARIPARLAEGIDLDSKTRQKRVFWTELWSGGRWWPVSASRGWFGRMPPSYVPLTLDGDPVLSTDPPRGAIHAVHATRLKMKS